METTKKITGKFTPDFQATVKQFSDWLIKSNINYAYKSGMFTIDFKNDEDFEHVRNKAYELDIANNPQMDLFDEKEPKDVTEAPELIEAPEFEEVEE